MRFVRVVLLLLAATQFVVVGISIVDLSQSMSSRIHIPPNPELVQREMWDNVMATAPYVFFPIGIAIVLVLVERKLSQIEFRPKSSVV